MHAPVCVCMCVCVCVCVWWGRGPGWPDFSVRTNLASALSPRYLREPLNLQSGPRYSPCSPFIRLTVLVHHIPLWSCELKDGFISGRSAQTSTRILAPAGSGACQNDSNTCCKVVLRHATRLLGFAPFNFSHSSTAVERKKFSKNSWKTSKMM